MKRSEAIDLLNNLIGVIEDNHNSDYDMALLIGIKAIEQEPFMNKPCISANVCEHDKNVVLDKVRAEIEKLSRFEIRGEVTPLVNVDSALTILDKYKAESEE